MTIPDWSAVVAAAVVRYPAAWAHAHREGDPRRWEWIRLCAADLAARDPRFGLNGKRGVAADLSADAVNFLGAPGVGRTPEGVPCQVIDVAGSAGGPAAVPAWQVFTDPGAASGAWVWAGPVAAVVGLPVVPYPDEPVFWGRFAERVEWAYQAAQRRFPDPADPSAFRWFARAGYRIGRGEAPAAVADAVIQELKAGLAG